MERHSARDPREPAAVRSMTGAEAIRLARTYWLPLALVPILVCATATGLYLRLPLLYEARATVPADLSAASTSIGQLTRETGARMRVARESNWEVLLTSESEDPEIASETLAEMISSIPASEGETLRLSPAQALELRALEEYRSTLRRTLDDTTDMDSSEPALLRQELALVDSRLSALELHNVAVVGTAPVVSPVRRPPATNVAVFSLLATLFATWSAIYLLDRRRVRHLDLGPD